MTYAYVAIDIPNIKANGITVEPVEGCPTRALVNLGNGIRLGVPAHAAERVAQALRDALAPEGDRPAGLEAPCEADPAFTRAADD